MVVPEDGKDDNGQKKENEKGGGEEPTEVPVSDEKSGRRFSVPTPARSMETKQVRSMVKASIRINSIVGQKTGRWIEGLPLSEVLREESPGYEV